MSELPKIMVAPNGARRTKRHHPALPITIAEIVETAAACCKSGADGIHSHVRDGQGNHVLDAGLYKELLAELAAKVPQLAVQITTEAVGAYSPKQQRELVGAVMPKAVSVSLREMLAKGETDEVGKFYHLVSDQGIALQHILYDADELHRLARLIHEGTIPAKRLQLLFVLGRHDEGQRGEPEMLQPFLSALRASHIKADWALCAFGPGETDCLVAGYKAGGKIRVGFENSLWNRDGSVAANNAERVAEIVSVCGSV